MPATPLSVASRGFTLLEVMMVVLVVGILSGIVLLSLNPGGAERKLDDEADRLVALLSQTASEAVMQNREYGLKLTATGYFFLCLDEDKQRWRRCADDDTLRERELPDGLEIHLLRDSHLTLPLMAKENDKGAPEKSDADDSYANDKDDEHLVPDILLLSSGEASPASVEIQVSEQPALKSDIRIDELGRVTRDEEPDGNTRKPGAAAHAS